MSVPTIVPPRTRDEIIAALAKLHDESEAYWNAFDTDAFFQSFGPSWSPAENVRHLNKATRPVALAMSLRRIALRLKFGKGAGTSIPFEQIKTRYDDRLAAGGKAGPTRRAGFVASGGLLRRGVWRNLVRVFNLRCLAHRENCAGSRIPAPAGSVRIDPDRAGGLSEW